MPTLRLKAPSVKEGFHQAMRWTPAQQVKEERGSPAHFGTEDNHLSFKIVRLPTEAMSSAEFNCLVTSVIIMKIHTKPR